MSADLERRRAQVNAAASRWRSKNPRTEEQKIAMREYQKTWSAQNKALLAAQAKQRYEANKERIKANRKVDPGYPARKAAAAKRHRERHPDRHKARHRRYYEANKAKVLASCAEWAKRNPDKVRAAGNRWRKNNPEAAKDARLRHAYGITLEEFNSLGDAQGWVCAICEREKPLWVDHCHETQAIRGLLCARCNSGIGQLGDTAATVALAVAYLQAAERRKVAHCA